MSDRLQQYQVKGVILCLDPNGRAMMTRDMELIRKILLQIQNRKDSKPEMGVTVEGYDQIIVDRHLEMLFNAGFLEGAEAGTAAGIPLITIRDLSWAGHDFIASLENEGVWDKIKQKLSPTELATVPLAIIKDLGTAVLKSYLMGKLGLADS